MFACKVRENVTQNLATWRAPANKFLVVVECIDHPTFTMVFDNYPEAYDFRNDHGPPQGSSMYSPMNVSIYNDGGLSLTVPPITK